MTTDELNAIVKAVMDELEKAGVDFDFKAKVPQADDLVYVMRGTADKYQGITVKWQNLLDIIVQKATEARDDAISAKDIALQTLATIQSIESNVSSMKSSVETTKGEVETLKSDVTAMKASVEASEANVTQMKSDVSEMKTSVEGTKTEVENIKEETAGLLDTKADVTYVDGELAKKVNYTDSLTYEEIMATTDLSGKVSSASALKALANSVKNPFLERGIAKDLNTIIDSGAYSIHVSDGATNYPFAYGVLLVFNPRRNYIVQIALSSIDCQMAIRFTETNGSSWKDWRTI